MLTADKILRDMIDVINVIIKGIVMYFLAIMFNFWGYQGGGGNFSPFRCMLIFICAFEIFLTEKFFEKLKQSESKKFLLSAGICLVINFIISRCIGAGKNAFFIISMFPFAENIVCRYRLRNQAEFTQTMRNFSCRLSEKYGIALCLIALFTIIESDYPSADYPVSTDRCTIFFYVCFVIYLSLIVLLKYVKMQYTESRKYYGSNMDFLKRQLRTDSIVLIFCIVIFLPAVFIVQNTIFVPLCMLIIRICFGLSGAGISVISDKVMENLLALFSMTEKAQVTAENEVTGVMIRQGMDFSPVMLIIIVCAIALVAVFVMGLLKLYKIKGVSFTSEEEEAAFVEEEELKTFEVQEIITVKYNSPHNNNGTIRKYYYKYMNNKIKKSRLKEALSSTPTELEEKFTEHDDKAAVRKLTEKYERVRYSNDDADANEVNEAKRLYRKLIRR